MDAVIQVWQAIRATLDEMGNQAITAERAYGLRCYPYTHDELFPGAFRKDAWEEKITDGLARGLRQRGIRASTEDFYPGCRERCDLVITMAGKERLWVECKTAYRESTKGLEGDRTVEPTGKSSWVAGVSDIAGKDIVKLNGLRLPYAQYVGVLLLGFDRLMKPLTNEELYGLLPPELDRWLTAHGLREGITTPDHYPGRARKGFRNRLWFWCRRVMD